ncbi:MAG TPA: J domain-containing protein [Aggregatilineaceae bacterium]|nr:J domain-containing protein [Aggregatilineaceae bacterium]
MDAQIARLKADIASLETQLVDLESEVLDIERELDQFTTRYNQRIKPLQLRLEIIQSAIAELEKPKAPDTSSGSEWTPPPGYESVEEQYRRVWRSPDRDLTPRPTASSWTPPSDYVSVEEQFRRTWQRPQRDSSPPSDDVLRQVVGEPSKDLKQIYRQLVRRYHPDLATDPVEREHRTRLMVEINEAYSRRDSAMLQALAERPATSNLDEPLSVLYLRQLQQIYTQLESRIADLKQKRADLQNGDMMWLKIQDSLGAQRGHDFLREMANDLEREYRAAMARLDTLRKSD